MQHNKFLIIVVDNSVEEHITCFNQQLALSIAKSIASQHEKVEVYMSMRNAWHEIASY